jgi:hypothetical protein
LLLIDFEQVKLLTLRQSIDCSHKQYCTTITTVNSTCPADVLLSQALFSLISMSSLYKARKVKANRGGRRKDPCGILSA